MLQAPPAEVERAVQERVAQLHDDQPSVRRRSALMLQEASEVLSRDQRRVVVEALLVSLERSAREHSALGAARPTDDVQRRRLKEFMPARAAIRGAIADQRLDPLRTFSTPSNQPLVDRFVHLEHRIAREAFDGLASCRRAHGVAASGVFQQTNGRLRHAFVVADFAEQT